MIFLLINLFLIVMTGGSWLLVLLAIWFIKKLFG